MIVAYRHAAYDTPWRVNPSPRAGRFHRALEQPVQYLCLHPLGPAAEMLRHHFTPDTVDEDLATLRLNLWAVAVDDAGVTEVTFDNALVHGIAPEDLVGEDYTLTQEWADRLREPGVAGVTVPSAALPGTDNLVLFGPRVLHPYLANPLDPAIEVRTGHLSDAARSPVEVVDQVRWIGDRHSALETWTATGTIPLFLDPLAP